MTINEALAKNLSRMIAESDYPNTVSFAESVGVEQSMVYSYTRGARVPNLATALKLAKGLRCTLDDLVKGAE